MAGVVSVRCVNGMVQELLALVGGASTTPSHRQTPAAKPARPLKKADEAWHAIAGSTQKKSKKAIPMHEEQDLSKF
jgi:hypothetical protein